MAEHLRPVNSVLRSLPAFVSKLGPALEFVDLPFGATIIEAGSSVPYVYFLDEGVASVVIVLTGGGSVEVGLIDKHGVIGAPPWFDATESHYRVLVQGAGRGHRIKSSLFASLNGGAESAQMASFSYLYGLQIAQTAACNRLHSADHRLARWLLMMDDRIAPAEMLMTQEFLGLMLGTRRSTVNIAAGVLQKANAIRIKRNRIQIVDRGRLELASCECYNMLRQSDARRGIVRRAIAITSKS